MFRAKAKAAMVVGVAGAVVGLGYWRTHGSRGLPPGPLALPVYSSITGIAIDSKVPFTFAQAVLWNKTNDPVVVERAALVGRPPGMQVLGVYVRVPRGLAIGPGTDMTGLSPVAGYPLAARQAVALVFHLSVSRDGVFQARGVRVWYRVGSTHCSLILPQDVKACAPQARYLHGGC